MEINIKYILAQKFFQIDYNNIIHALKKDEKYVELI